MADESNPQSDDAVTDNRSDGQSDGRSRSRGESRDDGRSIPPGVRAMLYPPYDRERSNPDRGRSTERPGPFNPADYPRNPRSHYDYSEHDLGRDYGRQSGQDMYIHHVVEPSRYQESPYRPRRDYDYGYGSFYSYPQNPTHNPGNNPHQGASKMDGINSDKVQIHVGGGDGGGAGGMGAAALVAALGSRNESRTDGLGALLLANRDNDGFGGGGIGALLLLALLGGNGIGGRRDCDNDGHHGALAILGKLGSIEGAVPLAAANIQNAILEQTSSITNTINQTGLAQLAATAGVKDSVQVGTTAILQQGSANTQSILTAICALSSKLDHNQIADLQRQLGVAQLSQVEDRLRHHGDGVEVRVNQNVVQGQAQAQLQQQQQRFEDDRYNRLCATLLSIGNQTMYARQGQDVINFGGTMTGSGTQAAANTQVR